MITDVMRYELPPEGISKVLDRLKGGGLVLNQEVLLDEGRVTWWLAITPHAWLGMLIRTARGMGMTVEGVPDRANVFAATGWGGDQLPWPSIMAMVNDGELRDISRAMQQEGLQEAHMAAIALGLEGDVKDRWLTALPVMMRERTEAYELEEDEAPRRFKAVAEAMLRLRHSKKIPDGRFSCWLGLYSELVWARRQAAIGKLLPLRHLIYGLDKNSLSRLLFDLKNDALATIVSGSEFPVVDQVRRAISPGYAVRLLEDVAVRRPKTNALEFQEALLNLYRLCHQGLGEGRYALRATPAERLEQMMRWLESPA